MGYEVHITRKGFWADEDDTNVISLQEWKDFIDTQADMRLDNFAEIKLENEEILRYENEGLAVWTMYSGNREKGNQAWFNYSRGKITVKNPDEELLLKMCSVSKLLNANVQGDDGEVYENGKLKDTPDSDSTSDAKKPWWRFW